MPGCSVCLGKVRFSYVSPQYMFQRLVTPLASLTIAATATIALDVAPATAQDSTTSANSRYSGLVQVMTCPEDRGTYGEYNDYGYWGGGAWCDQTGEAGYWVYSYPNWYVWEREGHSTNQKISANISLPELASANGSYYRLEQILTCTADRDTYGDYNDYGYWSGGSWCGQTGVEGYWVYVYPNWYVWQGAR
ncbi:MAG: hypothetical protein AAGA40_00730 [Cyanobacteria bacterium P01_E01_bin.45]